MAEEGTHGLIIGAVPWRDGGFLRPYLERGRWTVSCADGGYANAVAAGLAPDYLIGDWDSGRKPELDVPCVTLPVEKDVTDTMYAVIKGFAKGYRSFVLVGCLGGARFDHSLANLEVLQYILQHSGYGVMADSHTKVFLIAGSRLRLTEMKGATVSVFPYGTASCTVTYQGLLYPLAHDTLTSGGVLMGVSNTITADTAVIRVHAGTALVVVYTA